MLAFHRWALRLSRPSRLSTRLVSTNNAPGPRNALRRPPLPRRRVPQPSRSSPPNPEGDGRMAATSNALREVSQSEDNSLLTPVHIPEDPNGVLRETHPATSILANSSIVVQRQLEMMNILVGFEQANRYVIMDPQGNHIGYLAEQEHGLGTTIARQAFRTHRSFTTHVFDRNEREVLRFHRPFSWISSRIRIYDAINAEISAEQTQSAALSGLSTGSLVNQSSASISPLHVNQMRIIGESQQQWAPLRRKYNLFLYRDAAELEASRSHLQLTSGELPLSNSTALQTADQDHREGSFVQFAYVNEPFLSWDFTLLSSDDRLIGSVNRNFAGLAREVFTDTGVYALRMDAAGLSAEPAHLISRSGRNIKNTLPGMTLDQRAIMLATAVSIDFDYFSRHSHAGGGGFFPILMPWGGGEAASAGAAGEAGAGGAVGEAGSAVGAAARGAGSIGASEGAIAGAGTMAGYEAMQRARERHSDPQQDDASPVSGQSPPNAQNSGQQEDVWGEAWPSGSGQGGASPPGSGGGGFGDGLGGGGSGGGGGGGGSGGGSGFDWDDWY